MLNVEHQDNGKMSACLELSTGKVLPHMEMSVGESWVSCPFMFSFLWPMAKSLFVLHTH